MIYLDKIIKYLKKKLIVDLKKNTALQNKFYYIFFYDIYFIADTGWEL